MVERKLSNFKVKRGHEISAPLCIHKMIHKIPLTIESIENTARKGYTLKKNAKLNPFDEDSIRRTNGIRRK